MKARRPGRKHLLVWVALWAQACAMESGRPVLGFFFDGTELHPPPADGPPASLGAAAARPTPPPERVEEDADPRLELQTYAALAGVLPKDGRGNLDWVQAAEKGLIAPRPNIDPKVPEFPELPMDVVLDPGVPNFEVVFPHEEHTYWLHCSSCHPKIFEMKAGANDISMAKIFQGEFCGRCHGKVAFAPAKGCPRCHVQSGL